MATTTTTTSTMVSDTRLMSILICKLKYFKNKFLVLNKLNYAICTI